MARKPTLRIDADTAVAIHTPRVRAGAIQRSMSA
jgi:hypothetical protein